MATRTAVVAGTATAVSGRVARRQANRYDQQQPQQYEQAPAAPAPPPPAAAAPGDDLNNKMQQLAALHAQGALTDEEFSSAKAKLLGI